MNALALLLVAALLAPPVVADAPAQARTFHRFSFGRANGTVLSDGPLLYAENPFLVPALAVERNYAAAGRSTDPITLEQNVAVIDLPGVGRVMVDTGSRGDEPSPISPDSGRLFDNLKLAGIAPESIDYVVLTHGHLDHVNGLRLPGGGKAFPNAQVFINKKEHDFWSNPPKAANATDTSPEALQFFSYTYLAAIGDVKDSLTLVADDTKILPGVRYIFAPGHSPGLSAVQISSNHRRLLLVGDAWVTREDQLRHPEWGFEFETDRDTAYKSRIKLLSRAAKRKDLVLVYHEKFPGLGRVRKLKSRPDAFEWVPKAANCRNN